MIVHFHKPTQANVKIEARLKEKNTKPLKIQIQDLQPWYKNFYT